MKTREELEEQVAWLQRDLANEKAKAKAETTRLKDKLKVAGQKVAEGKNRVRALRTAILAVQDVAITVAARPDGLSIHPAEAGEVLMTAVRNAVQVAGDDP